MTSPIRIDVEQAFEKSTTGDALLVCAYDDEEKCNRVRLKGALTLGEFRARKEHLPPTLEIIFYCT